MKATQWSKRFMAAAGCVSLLFTGNTLVRQSAAVQPEETLSVTVPATAATVPATQPPTEATIPKAVLACEAIAERADGRQVFVFDGTRGEMVYCNVPDTEKIYPASITKLYSALVALMYLDPDQEVTAGEELKLMQPGSSRAYVSKGCRLTVEMLIEAMLIPSGNDASYVVAAAAGRVIGEDPDMDGQEAAKLFIDEMNRQAPELGLTNSHFVNPDGYHDENHYTCPADAAKIGMLAMQQPVMAKYMGKQQDSVTFKSGERIAWYNTNHLINPESPYYMENAVGLKTGYTGEAGQCLLAGFREDGQEIIVGIFGSEGLYRRYDDVAALYEACTQ